MNKKSKSESHKKATSKAKKRKEEIIQEYRKYKKEAINQGHSIEASILNAFESLEYPIETIIESIGDENFDSPEKEISLGYAHIIKAICKRIRLNIDGYKDICLGVIWHEEEYEKAIEYFESVVDLCSDKGLIYLLMKHCYEMVGRMETANMMRKSFEENISRKNDRSKEMICKINKIFSHSGMRIIETQVFSKNKILINKTGKKLESAIEENHNNKLAFTFLIQAFIILGRRKKYFNLLKKWIDYDPNPIAYELLGREYLRRKKYDLAAEYIANAMKLYENAEMRKIICRILYEYSSGLQYLVKGRKIQDIALLESYNCFSKCEQLIEKYRIEEFNDIKCLPSILDISNRCFSLFSESKSLSEIRAKLKNIYSEIDLILSRWKSFEQYIKDTATIGDPISDLLLVLFYYVVYLGNIFKIEIITKNTILVMKEQGESEKKYWNKTFRLMKKIITNHLGFSESGDIFDKLKELRKEIGSRIIVEIPKKESKNILIKYSIIIEDKMKEIALGFLKEYSSLAPQYNFYFDFGDEKKKTVKRGEGRNDNKIRKRRRKRAKSEMPYVKMNGISQPAEIKIEKELKPFKEDDEKFIELNKLKKHKQDDYVNELIRKYKIKRNKFIEELYFDNWLKKAIKDYENVIMSDRPLLFHGESGVGKTSVSELFYRLSGGEKEMLRIVNCAQFEHNLELAEDYLFGHKKGAFTGAINDKKGLLEVVNNGCICFENIENLPFVVQLKLLKYLESGEYERLGDVNVKKSNARIIGTYVRDIEEMIKEGLFSEQFLYRIKSNIIKVPLLIERKEEIEEFISFFIERLYKELKVEIRLISKQLIKFATTFSWRNTNFRGLRDSIYNSIVKGKDDKISLSLFLSSMRLKQEIGEIWTLYGKDFGSLRDPQKKLLYKYLPKEKISKANFLGIDTNNRETANRWLHEMEEKGFLKKDYQKGKEGRDEYIIKEPFLP